MKVFSCVAGCMLAAFVAGFVGPAQAQATRPANEIPMYGDPDRPNKLNARDRAFIASIEKAGKSRRDVSQEVMRTGWDFLQKGDLKSAIKHFNQAWLIDQENPNVYHGFALISVVRDNAVADAEKFFRIALAKPGINVNAYVDYGRLLWIVGRLDESLVQLRKALDISPTAHNARANMAMVYYKKSEYAKACELARGARENNDIIATDFLEEMCRRGATG